MAASQPGPRYSGWFKNTAGDLEAYSAGTKFATAVANAVTLPGAVTVTGALVGSGAVTSTGVFTASAEARIAEGFNLRIGTISTFGTTQPTNAVVMRAGTAPVGAITTAGGLFSTATVIQKIIAAGTVTNVET